MKILIIDDERGITDFLSEYIEEVYGSKTFKCYSYNAGQMAIKNIDRLGIDLIICDLSINGRSLISECAETGIKTIVMTGSPEFYDPRFEILYKPFEFDHLDEILRELNKNNNL